LKARISKGFTLLEVMISVAILAIAFVAILGIRDRSIRTAVEAQELSKATLVASKIMGLLELESLGSDREGVEDGFTWVVSEVPAPIENLTVIRLEVARNKEVILAVTEYIP
jgi:prepilin-type N-terminal cleavage/methylation domain-containing protein